jgi:hypothetical protein
MSSDALVHRKKDGPTTEERRHAKWVLPLDVVLKIDRQSQRIAFETAHADLAHAEDLAGCRFVAELANSQATEQDNMQREWKALAEEAWARVRELRDAA